GNMAFRCYNGTYQTTFIDYGLQWGMLRTLGHRINTSRCRLCALSRTNGLSGAIPQLPKGKSGFALVQDGRPCRVNLVR
ncbi:hypothetical protein BGW80DRAFT_1329570, partial [Lactifluus volemus]